MGFRPKAGSELEYYLLTDTYEQAWHKGYVGLERFGYYNEDYHLLQATKGEPIHAKLRNLMTQAGIPIEFSKGEAAPGQHEVNIRYDDVLEMADRTVLFKHGAKEIAYLNGFGLTFMAKPDHTWTGSSGHLHMSLWDASGEQAAFFEEGAEPYGMSPTMRHFLGGMMQSRASWRRSSRRTSTRTSASRSRRGRRSTWCGAATTAPPASGSWATDRRTSRTASPAAT